MKGKSFFKNGIQSDTMKVFFKNGNLQEICLVKDGKKNGFYKTYFESGKLRSDGFAYKNGHDSLWKYFNQDGSVDMFENYSRDTLLSVTKYFRNEIEYSNKICNYRIRMPKQWTLVKEDNEIAVLALKHDDEPFKETATILVRDLNDLRLNKFIDAELKYTAKYTSDFRLITREKIDSVVQIIYVAKYSGFDVEVLSAFLEVNNKIYTLTFIARQEEFSDYAALFKEATRTFKVGAS